jgi:hypothetical protein
MGEPRVGHSRSVPSAVLLTAAKELKEMHRMRRPYGHPRHRTQAALFPLVAVSERGRYVFSMGSGSRGNADARPSAAPANSNVSAT